MEKDKLRPVSWGYFYGISLNSGDYELQTAVNCCCGICRDLGYKKYEELKDIIKTVGESIAWFLMSV